MRRLVKVLFFVFGILDCGVCLYGAKAAEPYTARDLYEYGAREDFDATVYIRQTGGACSASRVAIGKYDPVDFYLTAAHCMPGYGDESEEAMRRRKRGKGNKVRGVIDVERVGFVKQKGKDLVLFTTGERTRLPRYNLSDKRISYTEFESGVSVGYGTNYLAKRYPGMPEQRQAFRAYFLKNEEDGKLFSYYLPVDKEFGKFYAPLGKTTKGDSGGSLLIKERGDWRLRGVLTSAVASVSSVKETYATNEVVRDRYWGDGDYRCAEGEGDIHACYGSETIWEEVDVDFIQEARSLLLEKKPIYWDGYVGGMSGGGPDVSVKIDYDGELMMEGGNHDELIGYASGLSRLKVYLGEERVLKLRAAEEFGMEFDYNDEGIRYTYRVSLDKRVYGSGYDLKLTMVGMRWKG